MKKTVLKYRFFENTGSILPQRPREYGCAFYPARVAHDPLSIDFVLHVKAFISLGNVIYNSLQAEQHFYVLVYSLNPETKCCIHQEGFFQFEWAANKLVGFIINIKAF